MLPFEVYLDVADFVDIKNYAKLIVLSSKFLLIFDRKCSLHQSLFLTKLKFAKPLEKLFNCLDELRGCGKEETSRANQIELHVKQRIKEEMLLSVQLCESDLGHGLEQRIAVLDAQKTTLYAISLELNNCLGALDTAASGLLKDIAKDIVGIGMKQAEYILTNRSNKHHQPKTQEPAKMPAKTPAQTQDQPNYMKTSLEGFLCLLGPCSLKQAVKNEQRMIAHLEVEHGGGAEARSLSDNALIPAYRIFSINEPGFIIFQPSKNVEIVNQKWP